MTQADAHFAEGGAAPNAPLPSDDLAQAPAATADETAALDGGGEGIIDDAGLSSEDAVLEAAQRFENQLERMSTWKLQLAKQMELLRRDGVKILERQKMLAQEKQKLDKEREGMAAERAGMENAQQAISAQRQEVEAKAAEIARTEAELAERSEQREKLARDVSDLRVMLAELEAQAVAAQEAGAAARAEAEAARGAVTESKAAAEAADGAAQAARTAAQEAQRQKDTLLAELDAAQSRLADMPVLEARRDELSRQLEGARETVARLDAQREEVAAARKALEEREAEIRRRETVVAEQEARCLAHDSRLQAALSQLDAQRIKLSETQRAVEEERALLAAQREVAAPAAPPAEAPAERVVEKIVEKTVIDPETQARAEKLAAEVDALGREVAALQQRQAELMLELTAARETLRRHADDALLTQNNLQGQLVAAQQQLSVVEAEKQTWNATMAAAIAAARAEAEPAAGATAPADTAAPDASAMEQLTWHRDRLLHRALSLRTRRKQLRGAETAVKGHFLDLRRQREHLRARKENLEHVQRLLEKQELVMARKLADHSALKTVAAVGIFVIMVLGSAFLTIYTFINPVYRAEATITLATPPRGQDPLDWAQHQADFIPSAEVTAAAWKVLRAPDQHYAMQDVREQWVASLQKSLKVQPDNVGKTISIQYEGPNADGVSKVCNALATAYATPALRDTTPDTRANGAGATVSAVAAAPRYPIVDHRLMLALSSAATALFLSLLAVMIFRHLVARQLKEIDQMADENELEEMVADLETTEQPAAQA